MTKLLVRGLVLLQGLISAGALAQGTSNIAVPKIAEQQLSFAVGKVGAAKGLAPLITVGADGRVYVLEDS